MMEGGHNMMNTLDISSVESGQDVTSTNSLQSMIDFRLGLLRYLNDKNKCERERER